MRTIDVTQTLSRSEVSEIRFVYEEDGKVQFSEWMTPEEASKVSFRKLICTHAAGPWVYLKGK